MMVSARKWRLQIRSLALDISTNIDSTALTEAFSFTRQKDKAMHGLKGILSGIVADKRLNEKEFLFLDAWLKSQQYLAEDTDVLAILSQVGDILEDGEISYDELTAMQSHIEAIAAQKDAPAMNSQAQMDELLGFITGVASDGVLNDDEIIAMSNWMDRNSAIHDVWPATIIGNRLSIILEDGIITDEERADLLIVVNRITGKEPGITYEVSTEVWEDKIDSLRVEGAIFCLTGDFVSGDRDSIDTMLKCLGAQTSTSVNRSVDYLVIGTLASRDWLYTSHGRKIEKALLLKREGSEIAVITERTLLKFTRKLTTAA